MPATQRNTGSSVAQPLWIGVAAPSSVTGSWCDQSAIRGPASPWCMARSAAANFFIVTVRNSSAGSMIIPPLAGPGAGPSSC
jgi:hypothetical protein